MTMHKKQVNQHKDILYKNIILMCRNTLFYTNFHLIDTFQNRIHLIFIHISFVFIRIKQNKSQLARNFSQEIFDLIFNKIELNMREIGYGDTVINKNMKFLVKTFYNILLKCENYKLMAPKSKNEFLGKYLKQNITNKTYYNTGIIDYFSKYEAFCFDLSSDSVLKGDLKFNYK